MGSKAKMWVALLGAVLAAVIPGFTQGWDLSFIGWVNVGVLAAGAVMVYNATNLPGYPVAKLIASAVAGVGVVLLSALSDMAISPEEGIQMVLALFTAVGVYGVRNGTDAPAG